MCTTPKFFVKPKSNMYSIWEFFPLPIAKLSGFISLWINFLLWTYSILSNICIPNIHAVFNENLLFKDWNKDSVIILTIPLLVYCALLYFHTLSFLVFQRLLYDVKYKLPFLTTHFFVSFLLILLKINFIYYITY